MPTPAPANDAAELRDPRSLRPHGLAGVPLLGDAEYRLLRDSIGAEGLRHPLAISRDGEVLDGRARLQALLELGHKTAPVIIVEPEDRAAFVLRAALSHRQLSASQRAAVAAMLAQVEQARQAAAERSLANLQHHAGEVAMLPARGERTRELVAKLAGTSARTAQDVLTVQAHDPALFERVLHDELSASTAASKVRRSLRDAALPAAPPLPEGPFELILADPPWSFGSPDSQFAPEQHYPTMSMQELHELQPPATENSVLFLWAVNALLPDALALLNGWGFTYKSNLVWVKNGIGPGVWLRQQHELLLIATRGKLPPPDQDQRCSSVIEAARGRHSQKPEESYLAIERAYPHLSKLELFARGTPRPGWTIWGNQANTPPTPDSEQT
jgi:N6-adenosine-specific RNA methylase IME4